MSPTITVGFVPRERFATGARTLRRLLQYTSPDCQLVVVDSATPRRYWRQIERMLDGRDNVEVIHVSEPLVPNESKNLIAAAADGDYTCLTENDLLVSEGWLSRLLSVCDEYGADAVAPRVMEGSDRDAHADQQTGHFDFLPSPAGLRLDIAPLASIEAAGHLEAPQRVEVTETHCLFLRTDLLRSASPFDGLLNTREFIDTGLSLRQVGASLYFDPACRTRFLPPPRVRSDERAFFFNKWDYQHAVASHQRVREKWHLAAIPEALDMVKERAFQLTYSGWLLRKLTTRWRSAPGSALKFARNPGLFLHS